MCVGIIISCTPCLSLLARHPASKSFLAKFSLKSSSTKGSGSGILPSLRRSHGYSKAESENDHLSNPHDIEFGHVGTFATNIATGPSGISSPHGIYTTHEVQQWTEPT